MVVGNILGWQAKSERGLKRFETVSVDAGWDGSEADRHVNWDGGERLVQVSGALMTAGREMVWFLL